MGEVLAKFTVFFEEPFWVGVYERWDGGYLEVCKITFGPEPKDYIVYEFLHNNWNALTFSPAVKKDYLSKAKMNPKRMKREINRFLQVQGVGTKAQQALKLQHEQVNSERQIRSKQQKEEEKERRFLIRTEKRKAKHRGK